MATLSEIIVLWLAVHRFTTNFHMVISSNIMTERKMGRDTKELEQFKHLSTKTDVTSTVAITEKNEKQSNHTASNTRAPRDISRQGYP